MAEKGKSGYLLDTNILIWGVKKEAEPGQDENIEKSRLLIEYLQEEQKSIYISVISLVELNKRPSDKVYQTIQNLCPILPVDLEVVSTYYELIESIGILREKGKKGARRTIATMVLATAKQVFNNGLLQGGDDQLLIRQMEEGNSYRSVICLAESCKRSFLEKGKLSFEQPPPNIHILAFAHQQAKKFGEIWKNTKELDFPNYSLIPDEMILATAISNKVKFLITNDKSLRRYAEATERINVLSLEEFIEEYGLTEKLVR